MEIPKELKEKVKTRWYWLAGTLIVSILLGVFLSAWAGTAVFLVCIIAILKFEPMTYFASGLAVSVLTGIFLAARAQSLAASSAILAFVLFCAGALLGAAFVFKGVDGAEDGPGGE